MSPKISDIMQIFHALIKLNMPSLLHSRLLQDGQSTDTFWLDLVPYEELLEMAVPGSLLTVAEIEETLAQICDIMGDKSLSQIEQRQAIELLFKRQWGSSMSTVTAVFKMLPSSRHIAVTTNEALCLAPEQTEPGDLVCFVRGATIPFVLHKGSTEDRYRIVGGV
jgi:hypothetical protein